MNKRSIRLIAILLALSCILLACGKKSKGPGRDGAAPQSKPVIPQGEPITEGQTVTVTDVAAFTVESVAFTDDLKPPSHGSYYSHIPAEAGRSYADIVFAYQNLRTENVRTQDLFSAELYASGQYRYKGEIVSEEDSRSDFAYGSVTVIPLATEYVHCAFELPNAVAESDCALIALITVDQKTYSLIVREGGEGDLSASVTSDAEKKLSGELTVETPVQIPDACVFMLSDVRFTKDLKPSNPDSSYIFYYSAEDDKIYLDVCIRYSNLTNETVNAAKQISAKMTYAGKYEYNCKFFTEKADGSSVDQAWSVNVAPLCTETIHLLFEVPQMIASDAEPVAVSLTVDRCSYTLTVR